MLFEWIAAVALSLDTLPPLSDLDRFPDRVSAFWQLERCERHRKYLVWLRGINGFSGGAYDAWIAEMDYRIEVWRTLEAAHTTPFGFGDRWRQQRLALLCELLGDEDYLEGVLPDLMPEPPPETMPPAAAEPA
jgi:hypothetical protein